MKCKPGLIPRIFKSSVNSVKYHIIYLSLPFFIAVVSRVLQWYTYMTWMYLFGGGTGTLLFFNWQCIWFIMAFIWRIWVMSWGITSWLWETWLALLATSFEISVFEILGSSVIACTTLVTHWTIFASRCSMAASYNAVLVVSRYSLWALQKWILNAIHVLCAACSRFQVLISSFNMPPLLRMM